MCVVFAGPISSSALQLEQTLLVSCVLLADFRECVCVGSGGVGPTVDGLFSMETLSAKMKKTSLMPRWWKKRFTAVITESDPSFKVVYLGNVLTGWAKGKHTHTQMDFICIHFSVRALGPFVCLFFFL